MKAKQWITLVLSVLLLWGLFGVGVQAYYDFGGETITIVSWGPKSGDFQEGGWAPGRIEEAEELFNCTIEFEIFDFGLYHDSFMSRLLAGDSQNDVWVFQQRQFWVLVPQGAFYPVSDFLGPDYYENLPPLSAAMAQALTYQGKTYGFGVDYGAVHPLEFISYNKDMFEREGLPDLFELYQAGEWTWDKMTEIAIQATRDTTGDGEIDQFGIYSIPGSFTIWFAMSNDARVTREEEDGRMVFSFDEPNAIEAMQQVYEWYNVHRVVGGAWPADLFIDGKVAMISQGIYVINMINANMEESFGVVPLPRGPRAESHRFPAHALISTVLPSNSRHPEGKVELMDFLWPVEEYDERLMDYLSGMVRDRDSLSVLVDGHDQWSGEVFDVEHVIGGHVSGAIGRVLSGELSPAAAMDEIQPQVQAILDELYIQ